MHGYPCYEDVRLVWHFNLTVYNNQRVFVRVTLENCLGTRTKEVIPNKKVSFTAFLEGKFRSFYFYYIIGCHVQGYFNKLAQRQSKSFWVLLVGGLNPSFIKINPCALTPIIWLCSLDWECNLSCYIIVERYNYKNL